MAKTHGQNSYAEYMQNAQCRHRVGQVHTYNFFVSGPKFTIFCAQHGIMPLITPLTACRYLYVFQRYSRSNSKVVRNHTEFWTFSAL